MTCPHMTFGGVAPSLAAWLLFNHARTGNALLPPVALERYGNNAMTGPFWEGLAGNLISPGKGLLFFSPLAFMGLWGLCKRRRLEGWMASAGLVAIAVLHAKVHNWSGHWAWGPRYLIPALYLCLPGIAFCAASPATWVRRSVWVVALLSLPVQLLAVFVSWQARIAAVGAGDQSTAFVWAKSAIWEHLTTLAKWLTDQGAPPRMRKFLEAPSGLDLWWLTWHDAYAIAWPLALAAGFAVLAFVLLWRADYLASCHDRASVA